jgi:putative flippase GtrA
MKSLIFQAARFFIVGLAAMATHFLTFVLLQPSGIHPLVVNIIAFLVAFQVSFYGHFKWSFKESNRSKRSAMIRFFILALGGFLINESLFALLLTFTPLPEKLALLIVLFTVAGGTFLFSKFWAFSHHSATEQSASRHDD